MVAMSMYNLVDTFYVGRLGYQAVAAVTVALPFFIMASAIGSGTGIGVNALISRLFGERKVKSANRAAGQTVFLSLILGILIAVIVNIFPRQILNLCGATGDVLEFGEPYIRVIGAGMPLMLFSMISRSLFQASGDALRPMFFVIAAQVLNAILAPCLIFGWGFFPRLGMAGAGLATALASVLGAVLPLWFILKGKTAYHFSLSDCLPHPAVIGQIFKVGLPAMLMQATEGAIFAFFNHIIASYGSLALAGIGIAIRISDLAFMPVMGTANGLLPIVGYSLGAKMWDRLWSSIRQTVLWLTLAMVGATVLLEVFTPQVIRLFNSDPELLALAVPGMRIFCSTFVVIGPTLVFITVFQGLSKGLDAMILSLARQFIFFVPALLILPQIWGLTGVWVAMPVSDILGFLAAGIWMWREYGVQKKRDYWKNAPTAANPAKPGL
jgi:putative MATE family efflux protein